MKTVRRLRPDIVHTRNLSALEFQAIAALAGVPARVHGEHGWNIYDLDGKSFKYNTFREGVRPFLQLIEGSPGRREWLCLVIAGDGPLREPALKMLRGAGAEHLAWLPGKRDDIAEIMRSLDLFVLPSLNEDVSNTILEAMASGLPSFAFKLA